MDPITTAFFWVSLGLLIIGVIGQWIDGE